ncbi:Serine/threonine-protein kinase STY46 [Vitis vinifera]|uniref:Serine/threonine-protein kinase STY46 n=1 Tax=Vitis vinifera TaxID=29760 RepID=A0A438GP69_VITVI|nr:Serine/threonine-protein kinase STY46 [Vitis vinifera]
MCFSQYSPIKKNLLLTILSMSVAGNLLLTEDKKQIKVCDFGLAREETAGDMTTEAGTYRWMAPELFSTVPLPRGAKIHYDHKVDVYSFAVILWELLTNRTPFKGVQSILIAYAAANVSPLSFPQDIHVYSVLYQLQYHFLKFQKLPL